MIKDLEKNLDIPLIDPQRIPIKTIVDQSNLSPLDKKTLENYVASIYLVGLLNEQTIRIRHYKDENYSYYAIYIIKVALKKTDSSYDVTRIIHSVFPESTLLVVEGTTQTFLSGAAKRINKSDNTKTVVEEIVSAAVAEDNCKYVSLKEVNAKNLKEYNAQILSMIYKLKVLDATGVYPSIEGINYKELITQYDAVKSKLNKLEEDYRNASMMSEKAKIDDEIYACEKHIKDLTTKLGG